MKITIKVVIEQKDQMITENITTIERQELCTETLGLSLIESKQITSGIQQVMTQYQVDDYIAKQKTCKDCGKRLLNRGYLSLKYRTLFGKLSLKSPRLLECNCHNHQRKSFSPLARLLPNHSLPELIYLESKWASLMSYGMTTNLLSEILPLKVNQATLQRDTKKISTTIEKELGEEKHMYIDGCLRDWQNLPKPGNPISVALDGGYIHARAGKNRKAGWFEAIVGKSLQDGKKPKRFGYVVNYEQKPKRKLYEMLSKQGLQANQEVTFFSDGGDTVRELPLYLSPNSEHYLDWFHITMKITVMRQLAKGLTRETTKVEKKLDRVKWYIWHGNVRKTLSALASLEDELYCTYDDDEEIVKKTNKKKEGNSSKLLKTVKEFYEYIRVNGQFIPNYGDRYRHGENISTSFAESTVNELIARRMSKQQQMRWTKQGAHLLLQLRVKTLNDELAGYFRNWYPKIQLEGSSVIMTANDMMAVAA